MIYLQKMLSDVVLNRVFSRVNCYLHLYTDMETLDVYWKNFWIRVTINSFKMLINFHNNFFFFLICVNVRLHAVKYLLSVYECYFLSVNIELKKKKIQYSVMFVYFNNIN